MIFSLVSSNHCQYIHNVTIVKGKAHYSYYCLIGSSLIFYRWFWRLYLYFSSDAKKKSPLSLWEPNVPTSTETFQKKQPTLLLCFKCVLLLLYQWRVCFLKNFVNGYLNQHTLLDFVFTAKINSNDGSETDTVQIL